ncbi:hypothetical protein [Kocuria palustris]|uniref:hypothetical protein n=1 Tax=Kocuria palustris TaxID=71999 RepID=UPI0011873DA4|nr:hypothetical protein [Kocuria palustris]
MLQFYLSYGWWGIAGAFVHMAIMPLTAMAILQYGSYFRAQLHDKVFDSITSSLVSKFMDNGFSAAQFCIGFVMLAGAGSNLSQRFGVPLWVGSALILSAGMLNADRGSSVIGLITRAMIVVILCAAVYSIATFTRTLDGVHQFAVDNATSSLPNWFLATINYTGLSMFSGIAMAIIIGGQNCSPQVAGWGGFPEGMIFGVLLLLMAIGLLLSLEDIYDSGLPTLALVNEMNTVLGVIAAVATYLMIFFHRAGRLLLVGQAPGRSQAPALPPDLRSRLAHRVRAGLHADHAAVEQGVPVAGLAGHRLHPRAPEVVVHERVHGHLSAEPAPRSDPSPGALPAGSAAPVNAAPRECPDPGRRRVQSARHPPGRLHGGATSTARSRTPRRSRSRI